MDKITLKAASRSADESVKTLRVDGKVPAVVYGNTENTLIHIEENILKKTYNQAGESTLVELDIDGKKIPVLFHAVDFDPVSDRMIHVDFYAVNMKEEVDAEVHIRMEGESPAVKEFNAILVTPLHEVTVRALPANLPHDLAVDLSKLTEIDATITVADIVVPEGVTILNDPSEIIVIAQEQRAEEVEEVPVVAEGEAAVEGAEGAPVAEGEAAAGDIKKEEK